jgi:hypothetical protein
MPSRMSDIADHQGAGGVSSRGVAPWIFELCVLIRLEMCVFVSRIEVFEP